MSISDAQSSWATQEGKEHSKQSDRDAFGTDSKLLRQIEEVADEFSNQFLGLRDIVKQNSMRYEPNLQLRYGIRPHVVTQERMIVTVDYRACRS